MLYSIKEENVLTVHNMLSSIISAVHQSDRGVISLVTCRVVFPLFFVSLQGFVECRRMLISPKPYMGRPSCFEVHV